MGLAPLSSASARTSLRAKTSLGVFVTACARRLFGLWETESFISFDGAPGSGSMQGPDQMGPAVVGSTVRNGNGTARHSSSSAPMDLLRPLLRAPFVRIV